MNTEGDKEILENWELFSNSEQEILRSIGLNPNKKETEVERV